MKPRKYSGCAPLRREFKNIAEISEVINRGANYIVDRLNGKKQFTDREKRMLLRYIHEEYNEITNNYYFGG